MIWLWSAMVDARSSWGAGVEESDRADAKECLTKLSGCVGGQSCAGCRDILLGETEAENKSM